MSEWNSRPRNVKAYPLHHQYGGLDGVWQCCDCYQRVEAAACPVVCELCDGEMNPAPQLNRRSKP